MLQSTGYSALNGPISLRGAQNHTCDTKHVFSKNASKTKQNKTKTKQNKTKTKTKTP